MQTFNLQNTKMKNKLSEYTHLVFPAWELPGDWQVLEVETNASDQSTSYFMWAKLHPNEGPYIDFWGNEWPLGHRIIIRLVEFSSIEKSRYRFSVVTSRHTHSDMSTHRFERLEEAMEFMVNQMILTTKKFDKIHNTKTQIWDLEKIQANDPNFNTVQ